jgi:hypothetical protein
MTHAHRVCLGTLDLPSSLAGFGKRTNTLCGFGWCCSGGLWWLFLAPLSSSYEKDIQTLTEKVLIGAIPFEYYDTKDWWMELNLQILNL